VDIQTIEKRLSLLYNRLWKAGWTYRSAIPGNLTTTLDSSGIIIYFGSVSAMFLAALTSITLRCCCHALQLLGF
ncbi:hypothetical protein BCR34DRAFT_468924, partial [Clohesyomyces aquaticus]